MLRSLNTAVSGMHGMQSRLDIIGNNIANANTTGFKASRMDFTEAFAQSMSEGTATTGAAQVGTGVSSAAVRTRLHSGTIAATGTETDLAIDGKGFFLVRDAASGQNFVTRAGEFELRDGFLTTNGGLRVQGFSDTGLSTRGDIRIDDGTGKDVSKFYIARNGTIVVQMPDGSELVRGQVLVQEIENPEMLARAGNSLFEITTNAGASATLTVPGSGAAGLVMAGHREMSNVDLTGEFSELISTQRGFQANARIVTTSDEILQEVINLKR